MSPKIFIVTAMHGRHDTVRYCYDKMKDLPVQFLYGYSTEEDGEFLEQLDSKEHIFKYQQDNDPLWLKFQSGIDLLKSLDFDLAIMLGSDDFIDSAFIDFVSKQSKSYDFIGFKDIFFKQNNKRYYWPGYTVKRKGEPCGAGKVYTRKSLDSLGWELYRHSPSKGLDGTSWKKVKELGVKHLVTSIKKHGLTLVDIKDEHSLTPLSRFKGKVYKV